MIRSLLLVGASALATVSVTIAAVQGAGLERGQAPVLPGVEQRVLLDRYCVGCHNQKAKIAGLTLDTLDLARPGEHAEAWEKVVRKLRAGVMPPAGRPRPEPTAYEGLRLSLEQALDRAAAANSNP